MVLVVMMLATVTFDGFMETPLWVEIADQMSCGWPCRRPRMVRMRWSQPSGSPA